MSIQFGEQLIDAIRKSEPGTWSLPDNAREDLLDYIDSKDSELANLRKIVEVMEVALEFYAYPLYEASADNPQLRPIPENTPGKEAKESLAKVKEIRGDK